MAIPCRRYAPSIKRIALVVTLLAGCASGVAPENPAATYGEERDGVLGADVSVYSGPITDTQMDCMWGAGVRHVIVGTQELGIAEQQIQMAIDRGMTVDAYVYLVWSVDMRAQVSAAVHFARRHPVGMLWLDVEQAADHRSPRELEGLLQNAVDACGDFPCGIYTADWWWSPSMGGSHHFADLPLWYAYYDRNPSADTWHTQHFGGWSEPWGKQYDGDLLLCGVDADLDSIRVLTTPSRPHTTAPPAAPGVPAAPIGLWPTGYDLVPSWLDAQLVCGGVPGATGYDFAVENWNGSAYVTYFTFSSTTNARSFSPSIPSTTYRFRVRAKNGAGASAWSDWAYFQFGSATTHPPEPDGSTATPPTPSPSSDAGTPSPSSDAGTPSPAGDAGTPSPSSDAGTPSSAGDAGTPGPVGSGDPSPAEGARITSDSVTITRGSVAGASVYEFEIDYYDGAAYAHYYDYSRSTPSVTFWPAYHDTAFRWRVRTTTTAGTGGWSDYATFLFGAGATAPGGSTPPPAPGPGTSGAPTGLAPDGTTIITSSVVLSCIAVTGATSYDFAVDVATGGTFAAYYTYSATVASKTFYPATHGTQYRFRVRAHTAAGTSAWSSYATFDFR